MDKVKKLLRRGKAMILAYDQGFEHGASDFTDRNVNPAGIIKIANTLGFTGLAVHKGIAEKYRKQIKVPLIVKLNGKTNLKSGEPLSTQLCSVSEAKKLGAVAVGYTIYLGSEHEDIMLKEFSKIEEEAHKAGLVLIAWIYPRGKGIKNRDSGELMAYSARVALELDADIVKIQYNGKRDDLKWAVKAAGKTRVLIAGGAKSPEKELLSHVNDVVAAGAAGMAIGRNVWQSQNPRKIAEKIRKILFSG